MKEIKLFLFVMQLADILEDTGIQTERPRGRSNIRATGMFQLCHWNFMGIYSSVSKAALLCLVLFMRTSGLSKVIQCWQVATQCWINVLHECVIHVFSQVLCNTDRHSIFPWNPWFDLWRYLLRHLTHTRANTHEHTHTPQTMIDTLLSKTAQKEERRIVVLIIRWVPKSNFQTNTCFYTLILDFTSCQLALVVYTFEECIQGSY